MGAWDTGPLENDDALVFIADLEESDDPTALLSEAMERLIGARGYVDAPTVCEAMAASALVAARHARLDTGNSTDEDFLSTTSFPVTEQLQAAARRCFERAFTPTDNELYLLRENSGLVDRYLETYAPFQQALSG